MSGRKSPLNDLDKKIIKKMYDAGHLPSKIAIVLEKSAQVVQRWVRENIPPEERLYACWVPVGETHGFSRAYKKNPSLKKAGKPTGGKAPRKKTPNSAKAKAGQSAKPSKCIAPSSPVAGPSSAID